MTTSSRSPSPPRGRRLRQQLLFVAVAILLVLLGLAGYSTYSQYRLESATNIVSARFGDMGDRSSVNGFAIFRSLLEQRGCRIDTTSLLTPQLDNHDVLIWLHNSDRLPQPAAFERVQQWMNSRQGLVVFIGNDHNAKPEFVEEVYRNSNLQDRQWARVVSRMQMSREPLKLQRQEMGLAPTISPNDHRRFSSGSCSWFRVKRAPDGFVGFWTQETLPKGELPVDSGESIRVVNYLAPTIPHETLAWCTNGEESLPLIWKDQSNRYSGELLVVSSASFLTNYGATQPSNHDLLTLVANEIGGSRDVQVLQSGPGEVPLSSTPEDRMVKTWSWMEHGPFPIAVLHVLALAVVFCFARFPVFGRAKKIRFQPRNDFGLHLEEIGRLLRRSRQEDFARQTIQHYFDVIKRSLIGRGPTGRS